MYGLGDRDKYEEMEKRYNALVNVMSDLLHCGLWDIEDLFDSKNNIEVGEIVKNYVDEAGKLPTWSGVYEEALYDFASKYDLEVGVDVDIYTNSCLDTHIYVRDGLDKDLVEELEDLFNLEAELLY